MLPGIGFSVEREVCLPSPLTGKGSVCAYACACACAWACACSVWLSRGLLSFLRLDWVLGWTSGSGRETWMGVLKGPRLRLNTHHDLAESLASHEPANALTPHRHSTTPTTSGFVATCPLTTRPSATTNTRCNSHRHRHHHARPSSRVPNRQRTHTSSSPHNNINIQLRRYSSTDYTAVSNNPRYYPLQQSPCPQTNHHGSPPATPSTGTSPRASSPSGAAPTTAGSATCAPSSRPSSPWRASRAAPASRRATSSCASSRPRAASRTRRAAVVPSPSPPSPRRPRAAKKNKLAMRRARLMCPHTPSSSSW